MTYALDTNVIVRYLRGNQDADKNISDAIMRGDNLVVPIFVNYEIMRGFRILYSPKKEATYKLLVHSSEFCKIIDMNDNCWINVEIIYEKLHCKGLTVGELDILIASICLEYGATLVTSNTKNFDGIDGLMLENWTGS